MAHGLSLTWFCKQGFIRTGMHSFIHALSKVACQLQTSWIAVTETICSTKLAIFVLPYTEKKNVFPELEYNQDKPKLS